MIGILLVITDFNVNDVNTEIGFGVRLYPFITFLNHKVFFSDELVPRLIPYSCPDSCCVCVGGGGVGGDEGGYCFELSLGTLFAFRKV